MRSYDRAMSDEVTYEIVSASHAPGVTAWEKNEYGTYGTYDRLVGPVIVRVVRYTGEYASRGDEVQFSVMLNGDPYGGWYPEADEIDDTPHLIFLPDGQKPVNA